MAKKRKTTKVYIDGKKVKVGDCKRIKGFNSRVKHLKNLCFLPDMKVGQNFTLSSGKTMKIVVSNTDTKFK